MRGNDVGGDEHGGHGEKIQFYKSQGNLGLVPLKTKEFC